MSPAITTTFAPMTPLIAESKVIRPRPTMKKRPVKPRITVETPQRPFVGAVNSAIPGIYSYARGGCWWITAK